MTDPLDESYAMEARERADGLWVGVCSVQSVPSHVQVSLQSSSSLHCGPYPEPPNRTTVPVAASYAIGAPERAGGLVGGVRGVHTLPSQVHVSFSTAPP